MREHRSSQLDDFDLFGCGGTGGGGLWWWGRSSSSRASVPRHHSESRSHDLMLHGIIECVTVYMCSHESYKKNRITTHSSLFLECNRNLLNQMISSWNTLQHKPSINACDCRANTPGAIPRPCIGHGDIPRGVLDSRVRAVRVL